MNKNLQKRIYTLLTDENNKARTGGTGTPQTRDKDENTNTNTDTGDTGNDDSSLNNE